jgi:hypothetical protein
MTFIKVIKSANEKLQYITLINSVSVVKRLQ